MTHPVLSLYPFVRTDGPETGSGRDRACLLASIEQDDDKEVELETRAPLLTRRIAANTTLRTLEVKCDPQADWGVDLWLSLADGVKQNSMLEFFTVDLRGHDIGDDVVAALAAMLDKNSTLKRFELSAAAMYLGD